MLSGIDGSRDGCPGWSQPGDLFQAYGEHEVLSGPGYPLECP